MSYDLAAAPPAEPKKLRVLPPEVSNFVVSFWLALGFGAVLLLILWPEASSFLPPGLANVALIAILGGLAALGAYLTRGIAVGEKAAMGVAKMVLIAGMAVGLVGVIGFFIIRMSGSAPATAAGAIAPPNFFGASPLLASSMFAFAVLCPLLFALLGFFMAMRDEVEDYFNPPLEAEMTRVRPTALTGRDRAEALLDEAVVSEEELQAAELAAQEAAMAEGAPKSAEEVAAYEDHDEPLAMGDLSLDDEAPTEKKDEKKE